MTVTVWIDPNVRIGDGMTFAGFEDADGLPEPGEVVHVVEPESGLRGGAAVVSLDHERELIYLSVAWGTLTVPPSREEIAELAAGLIDVDPARDRR